MEQTRFCEIIATLFVPLHFAFRRLFDDELNKLNIYR